MLPALDRKSSIASKDRYQKIKGKKNKHKLKSNSYKKNINISSNKNLVQYSDVSSEELSSPEAGEIQSDFDEKHGTLHSKSNKLITDKLQITKVISPRNIIATSSTLSNQWELDSTLGDSSMSTNLNSNNSIEMASGHTYSIHKKNRKSNKKSKISNMKKKKKKDIKHKLDILSDCDNSLVKFSKCTNVELTKINGNLIDPVKKHKPSVEKSHTPPPLIKSTHTKVSKVDDHPNDEEKYIKRFKREDKR